MFDPGADEVEVIPLLIAPHQGGTEPGMGQRKSDFGPLVRMGFIRPTPLEPGAHQVLGQRIRPGLFGLRDVPSRQRETRHFSGLVQERVGARTGPEKHGLQSPQCPSQKESPERARLRAGPVSHLLGGPFSGEAQSVHRAGGPAEQKPLTESRSEVPDYDLIEAQPVPKLRVPRQEIKRVRLFGVLLRDPSDAEPLSHGQGRPGVNLPSCKQPTGFVSVGTPQPQPALQRDRTKRRRFF